MAEPIGEAYVVVTADIEDVKRKLGVIKNMFSKLKTAGGGGGGFGGLLSTLSKLGNILTALATSFLAITKVISFFFKILKGLVSFVTSVVVGAFRLLASILSGVLKTALGVVTGAVRLLIRAVQELYSQLRRAIDTFMVFENAMLTVKAISGATGVTFAKLTAKARELGRSTEFTASQAAEAMTNFSRAGFTAQQTLDAIGGTLDFATAAATSMHQATEIVTGVLGSLNLQASQTAHSMDVLIVASNNARTTAVELGEAFGRVGAIGAFMGTDITNLSASLMSLAESSMRGLEGGMQLRMMLRRFTDPKVVDNFKKLNVQLFTTQGNLRLTHDIVKDFEEATRGWNKQQKTAVVLQTLTARSSYPFLALLQQGSAEIKRNWEMLQNVNGATEKFAGTIRSSLVKQLIIVKSAWQDLQITVAQMFAPTIVQGAKVLTAFLNDVERIFNKLKPVFQLFMGTGSSGAAQALKRIGKDLIQFLNEAEKYVLNIWAKIKQIATWIAGIVAAGAQAVGGFFGSGAGATSPQAQTNVFSQVAVALIHAFSNLESFLHRLLIFLNEMMIAIRDVVTVDLPRIAGNLIQVLVGAITAGVTFGAVTGPLQAASGALMANLGLAGSRFGSAMFRNQNQQFAYNIARSQNKPFTIGQSLPHLQARSHQAQISKTTPAYWTQPPRMGPSGPIAPQGYVPAQTVNVPNPLLPAAGGGLFGGMTVGGMGHGTSRATAFTRTMSGTGTGGPGTIGTMLGNLFGNWFPKLIAAINNIADPPRLMSIPAFDTPLINRMANAAAKAQEAMTPGEIYRLHRGTLVEGWGGGASRSEARAAADVQRRKQENIRRSAEADRMASGYGGGSASGRWGAWKAPVDPLLREWILSKRPGLRPISEESKIQTRGIGEAPRSLKDRIAESKEARAREREALKRKSFADRAARLGLSPEELRSRMAGIGKVGRHIGGPEGGPTGATIGMSGTVQTVFGAMKVGVTEEVKRLDELIRLNKLLVDNTQTQALVP